MTLSRFISRAIEGLAPIVGALVLGFCLFGLVHSIGKAVSAMEYLEKGEMW